MKNVRILAVIGPGILVAATGVGAGDLATAAFTGSKLGVTVLWAVVLGAAIKYLLSEGLARWQLATGDTLLEGCVRHFGRPAQWLFLAYLLIWSFFVGAALMSAAGVAVHAMVPLFDARSDKIVYGMIQSGIAVLLVRIGGYRLFAKLMGICIAMMFFVVVSTAIALHPPWSEIAAGLLLPTIPDFRGEGLEWTIALIGGVGGTLTILCYGYWIREEGRRSTQHLNVCRIDLATGYTMTAIFGLAMVAIGSRIGSIEGGGATLITQLADEISTHLGVLGPTARWAFLVGAWGAIFSSLLGVWQSVPYLFADFWYLRRMGSEEHSIHQVNTASRPYRIYLFCIATLPAAGLLISFERTQKLYAIFGALFIPLLALALLILNGRQKYIGSNHRNSPVTIVILIASLLFFIVAGWFNIRYRVFG